MAMKCDKIPKWFVLPLFAGLLCMVSCGRDRSSALVRGVEALDDGSTERAVELFQAATRAQPDDPVVHMYLGVAYRKMARLEDAAGMFKKAADLSDIDARPLEFHAATLIELKKWDETRDVLLKARELSPGSARILTSLALVETRSGNAKKGERYLLDALRQDSKYPPALYNLAVVYRDENKDKSREYFSRYVKVAGNDPHVKTAQEQLWVDPASDLVKEAKKYMARQDSDSALYTLKKAIRQYPDSPNALWELAVIYDRYARNNEEAIRIYQEFIKRFPEDERVAEAGARLRQLVPSKEPGKRLSFRKSVVRDRDAALSAYLRGVGKREGGDYVAAIAHFTAAIEHDGMFANAFFQLGLSYRDRGESELARQAFLYALGVEPTMGGARYELAMIHIERKEKNSAIMQLTVLLQSRPNHAEANYLLGCMYEEGGRNPLSVRKYFERYLALAPDGSSADEIKEWLASNR